MRASCRFSPYLQKARRRDTIVVPHPKKNFGPGLVLKIYKQAGWPRD